MSKTTSQSSKTGKFTSYTVSAAYKVMKDSSTSKAAKTLAGSALTQRPDKKK